jgi:hypothetical protein
MKLVGKTSKHCQRNAEVYKFKAGSVRYLGTAVLKMIRMFKTLKLEVFS